MEKSATQQIVRSWILLKKYLYANLAVCVCLWLCACVSVWKTCVCVFVFMDLYYISFSMQSIACVVWVIPFQFCVSTRTSECNMINDVKRPVNAVSCDLLFTAHCIVVKGIISFNLTRNNRIEKSVHPVKKQKTNKIQTKTCDLCGILLMVYLK